MALLYPIMELSQKWLLFGHLESMCVPDTRGYIARTNGGTGVAETPF